MRLLFIDTETTGLFDYKKRAHEEGQPRMIELAAYVFRVPGEGGRPFDKMSGNSWKIMPDGWQMDDALAEKLGHGMTQADLLENGAPVRQILNLYKTMHDTADAIVGYNVDFDLKILRGEFRRAGMDDLWDQLPRFCVMRAATPIAKIAHKNGRGGYKWPKLSEAVPAMLGRRHDGAHTAEADVVATAELLFYLVENGHVSLEKITERKAENAGS